MLPDAVPREAERALARWGLLGESAEPVFAPGTRYPLAGLLLAAAGSFTPLKDGYYGLAATLLALVFLALIGEPGPRMPRGSLPALGQGVPPGSGTVGQDDPPQARPGRECRRPDHGAGPPPRRRPGRTRWGSATQTGTRVYYGTRAVQKTHVARLKFPAPATVETWVTGQDGDPVFMVVAEPSDSLAGEVRRLLPYLRWIVGGGGG